MVHFAHGSDRISDDAVSENSRWGRPCFVVRLLSTDVGAYRYEQTHTETHELDDNDPLTTMRRQSEC